eukprot:scaffold118715_cov31-Tisochrysis_lutea.AAC.6
MSPLRVARPRHTKPSDTRRRSEAHFERPGLALCPRAARARGVQLDRFEGVDLFPPLEQLEDTLHLSGHLDGRVAEADLEEARLDQSVTLAHQPLEHAWHGSESASAQSAMLVGADQEGHG